jgi:AcrR family transcriptional regulator
MSEDRRVQRTRKLLRDALLELTLERGYDAVTVQDITDRANLGRATLYLHYRDKEDLLLKSIEETMVELIARLDPPSAHLLPAGTMQPYIVAFEHAAENSKLYRILLAGHAAAPLALKMRNYIAERFKLRMGMVMPEYKGPVPMDVVAAFVAGSMLMMLLWWLENDMPYPSEDMARMTQQMTRQGVTTAMGIVLPE